MSDNVNLQGTDITAPDAAEVSIITPRDYKTLKRFETTPAIVEFKSFFKTVGGKKGKMCRYPSRLDPYGCGCAHNCGYCYARSQLDFRKLWDPKNPRVADLEKIERQIKKLKPGFIVRMGGMTDCLQPMELQHRVTLQTIRLLNQHRIGYLIVTKSPIIAYPPYLDALDPELAHIQISVTSLTHDRSNLYEFAMPPEQRIRAIYILQRYGFDVAIRLSPLIEEYMDFNTLNRLNINRCIVEFYRISSYMNKYFPLPYESNLKYSLYDGNYRHLPLEEKVRIIQKVQLPNISICEKVFDHYEYWKHNYNPNPDDCCNLQISQKIRNLTASSVKSNTTAVPQIITTTSKHPPQSA